MNLLFDTNIVLALARAQVTSRLVKALNPENDFIYASFATVAETQSIAYQNGWGQRKVGIIEEFFSAVRVIAISDLLIPAYIGIDAYSQRSHPDYQFYPFKTPRNLGKNDLYIAATASILNLRLITTDSDFDHLDGSFLSLRKIEPVWLRGLL